MIFYLNVNISNNMVRTRRFAHKIFNLGTFSRGFASTVDEQKNLPFPEPISKRWEAQSAFFMTIVGYWGRMVIRKFKILFFLWRFTAQKKKQKTIDDKFWEYQNENIWVAVSISYSIISTFTRLRDVLRSRDGRHLLIKILTGNAW